MSKRILLQCQALTYLYMGLGAIYTKYKDCSEDLEIDVLFTGDSNADDFIDKLALSKYVHNIYCINKLDRRKISKRINKLKNNMFGRFLYKKFYQPRAYKMISSKIPNLMSYETVFFSHEFDCILISYLKDIAKHIHVVQYGDGSGLLMRKNTKLINPFYAPRINPFLGEIYPDEVIALAPLIEDGSCEFDNIPVSATDPEVLSKLIENDVNVQKKINVWVDDLLDKYSNYENKVLLLTNSLEDKRFRMSEEDQINIYIDMIEKYCPDNSLVILKLHPTAKVDLTDVLMQRCKKNCVFEVIPLELKAYPVELYSKLMKNLGLVITFLSSSRVSLSLLYNVETTDALEVVNNYPLKDRVDFVLDCYKKCIDLYPNWDKKSILYKCDIVPFVIKFYENYNVKNKTK